MNRTGRFAPSPTGDLHFGSLIAAVASYLEVKSSGGRWLVRIEDVDQPREVPGSAASILAELQRFGMQSDLPVLYQSQRTEAYESAVTSLFNRNQAYWCGCSRSELPASGIYPGTCSEGLPPEKSPRSVRLRVHHEPIAFADQVQGLIQENLAETVGDFIIRRADRLTAYQLAVVVDDAFQGVAPGEHPVESPHQATAPQDCRHPEGQSPEWDAHAASKIHPPSFRPSRPDSCRPSDACRSKR